MRRLGYRVAALACAVALLGTVAGCGPDKPVADPSPGITAPAGGWPQPSGGALDEAMCGLLTPADLTAQGLPVAQSVPTLDLNALICQAGIAVQYWLVLQPNADSAGLEYAAQQQSEARTPDNSTVAPQSSSGVVPGADRSALTTSTVAGDNPLRRSVVVVQRKALLVYVKLTDAVDRSTAAIHLAESILARAPTVGLADTGPTHRVRYQVTGSGTVDKLDYRDPLNGQVVNLSKVALPWSIELPYVVVTRGSAPLFLVDAWPAGHDRQLTCVVSVDGRKVLDDLNYGSVHCDTA